MRTDRQYCCGLDAALSVVGGSVTEKVLIGALKELEADGIIVRKDFREVALAGNLIQCRSRCMLVFVEDAADAIVSAYVEAG
ncbi:hypothetical protein SSOG_07431 [Streptomyces himastatinicus ATCC 53653]|uniref:Uncharacterized protein n=1 Tax=Streptomyces himastatinicus ATCC 53653 TaxID=457427 RepID=D9WKM7_9ACTN|nr:hypothetical protein SSOG_07431 [Streptomyces himastatinicus ATCC 53653]